MRDGVLDWTDVAAPGVPSFEFVENQGDADIPIVWAAEPDGGWYIAFCAYGGHALTNRFDVSHIMAPNASESQSGLIQRDRNTLKALYARPIGTRILGARRD